MPDNHLHDVMRHHISGAVERGEAEPITEERRDPGSPAGNRARQLAEALSAIADTLRLRAEQASDHTRTEYDAGYADGMAAAYATCNAMIREHARQEDAR